MTQPDRRTFIKSSVAGAASLLLTGAAREPEEQLHLDPESGDFKIWLGAEAGALFEKNRIDSSIGTFHVPSIQTYRSFFAWDSGWNVISLMHLDPEAALTELQTIFAQQCDDGHIPHEVRVPELQEVDPIRKATIYMVRRQYDDQGRSAFIDPPSFLIAAGLLYEKTRDPRVLQLLPAMDRCADYLTRARDLMGDGLVSIIHPWESGTDSAPVFDAPMGLNVKDPLFPLKMLARYPKLLNFCAGLDWDLQRIARANRFVFEDVGMNSLTAAGLLALADLHEANGDPVRAEPRRQRARAMVEAMEELMWDDDAAFFYPRYDRAAPKTSRRKCLTGALPLITGLVSEDKARRLIEQNLKWTDHFFGPWLVPFNSASELAPEKLPFENQMLWRGHCIWVNMNWMAVRAAAAYHDLDLVRDITMSTARMVADSGFHEFYDPRTGQGGGAPGFTWPALLLDLMADPQD